MTLPDYATWAEYILIDPEDIKLSQKIEKALKQAFEQGYNLALTQNLAIRRKNNA